MLQMMTVKIQFTLARLYDLIVSRVKQIHSDWSKARITLKVKKRGRMKGNQDL